MVAHGSKWAGDAVEQLIVAVDDGTGFAVHQPRRADDLAAERLANRLVTQAYAENRDLTGEGAKARRASLALGSDATIVLLSTEGSAANPVPAG